MLADYGISGFWILVFSFRNTSVLCSSLMRFLWYNFFHFPGHCVASDGFIVVPFTSYAGLAIVAEANSRCGDFLSEKSCRHSTGSFSYFLVWTTRDSLSFHKFERRS